MSWLARSIANSLRLDDNDDEEKEEEEEEDAHNVNTHNNNGGDPKPPPKSGSEAVQPDSQSLSSSPASTPTAKRVKEDISELTKTISRQLWGVASFLAPPPEPAHPQTQISDPNHAEPSDQSSYQFDSNPPDQDIIAGIRSDFAEISGRFKSGISKLSGTKTVSDITKIASDFLRLGSEGERSLGEYDLHGVVGVNEEVVAFARNIAMHPETWLDFPLPDDADSDDFDLSDAQQEHALAVEHLAPRLAALRMELCPGYMSDGSFWKIYFLLLLPRLNKTDADLLSTPQILEAKAKLTEALDQRSKEKKEPDLFEKRNVPSKQEELLLVPSRGKLESMPLQTSFVESNPSTIVSDVEVEKPPVQSSASLIIGKSVVKEASLNPTAEQSSSGSTNRFMDETYEDDADDWLREDSSEMVGGSGTSIPTAYEDDVSFSDLEAEDGDVPGGYNKSRSGSDSSAKDSRDWVQLNRSSPSSDKDINSAETRHTGSEYSRAQNSEIKDSNDWLNVDDIDVI